MALFASASAQSSGASVGIGLARWCNKTCVLCVRRELRVRMLDDLGVRQVVQVAQAVTSMIGWPGTALLTRCFGPMDR